MEYENIILTQTYDSPCGTLILGAIDDCLCLCDWKIRKNSSKIAERVSRRLDAGFACGPSPVLEEAILQLDQYFARDRKVFDIPLLFTGTPFQEKVWKVLQSIPYGASTSYSDLANMVDSPKAFRAVANANSANAISIFVPCHRIIGSNGSLTGYAGGIETKRFLLQLESCL